MKAGIGDLRVAQEDGGLPTTLAAGSAAGESCVSVLHLRFRGAADSAAILRRHLVCFQMSPRVRLECRVAGRMLEHEAPTGSLAIYPAGSDYAVHVGENVDALLVAIDPGRLALHAAEESALEAQLIERFSAYDQALLDLARTLAAESAENYPSGPLFWNDTARSFVDRLVARHTSGHAGRARGTLSKGVLDQIRDYVVAHLDEPIEVATLAGLAGRSPFHFTRIFARAVGVTPYRYVVHLRLRRAIELIRGGQAGLAEIAVRTGFADQSHLSRWVRRVHGVCLTQLQAARPRAAQQESS